MPRSRSWFIGLLMGLALVVPTGCNVVAPVYLAVVGPGDIKKAHTLEPDRKTVILIDDPGSNFAQRRHRLSVGDAAEQQLMKKKIVVPENMISSSSAIALASQNKDGKLRSIQSIGRDLGAEYVIYAIVTGFATNVRGDELRPMARYLVSVHEVETGDVVFPPFAPTAEQGYPLEVRLDITTRVNQIDRTVINQVQQDLAVKSGKALAELFYDVEVPLSNRQ